MKLNDVKRIALFLVLLLMGGLLLAVGSARAATQLTTRHYGDVVLDGSTHSLPGSWNLADGPVMVEYTLDLSGAPNFAYTGSFSQAGYVGLFHVEAEAVYGARMIGYLNDPQNPDVEFPTYPDRDDTQELDDKFNLQRYPNPGVASELMYDVYCDTDTVASTPFGSKSNYGIWFDRDGVDQFQADNWGVVEGGTYNTEGTYEVQLRFDRSANSPDTRGIACATFSPNLANPDVPGGWGVPTGFNRLSGGGYEIIPAGLSFETDLAKMADMQVIVQGSPGNGTIVVRDLTVTGYLNADEGKVTGGGTFFAENSGNFVGATPEGRATFGLNAKQDEKKGASGQLEFQYHPDNLALKSTSYSSVSVGTAEATIEGVGTLNGADGYHFQVYAYDGDVMGSSPDRFEIRIWTDGSTFEAPLYRMEGNLQGGQIVIHK